MHPVVTSPQGKDDQPGSLLEPPPLLQGSSSSSTIPSNPLEKKIPVGKYHKMDVKWITNPSPSTPLKVLGYGVRLNEPSKPLGSMRQFPNAIEHWNGNPIIVRERVMIGVISTLTDKPDWQRKVHDPAVVEKWREEIRMMGEELDESMVEDEDGDDEGEVEDGDGDEDEDMDDDDDSEDTVLGTDAYGGFSEKMFDYCIEEMAAYAQQLERDGFFPAIDSTATAYKSDTLIPEQVKRSLQAAVAPLEDVPEDQRDWHPGSNQQVLDLVHPSLFPLLYGRSKILRDRTVPLEEAIEFMGQGETIPAPSEKEVIVSTGFDYRTAPEALYSSRFQWLPCEVAFTEGEKVKITSYVNNLHPVRHKEVYTVLEDVIARVIPMWNATLSSTDNASSGTRPCRITFDGADYVRPETPQRPPAEDEDQKDEEEILELDNEFRRNWILENLKFPEPGSFATRASHSPNNASERVDLRKTFAKSGLQVIVKLANIHLTPENPVYAGGTWHVEGQLNEHICASALYYYDSDNVTESYLEFREQMRKDYVEGITYEQDEYHYLEKLYSVENYGPTIQHIATVQTSEGRVLTFPNVFQHCVRPFELEDETKPGHRKILALFLVDPNLRIPSTANVPPQQREWATNATSSTTTAAGMPQDVSESTIELEEAKVFREELMAERSVYTEQVDQRLLARTFSFCEH